jgi:hypothetical protein
VSYETVLGTSPRFGTIAIRVRPALHVATGLVHLATVDDLDAVGDGEFVVEPRLCEHDDDWDAYRLLDDVEPVTCVAYAMRAVRRHT